MRPSIWKIDSVGEHWFVHACKIGTAINRTPIGNAKRNVDIRVELIKKNATKADWENFKTTHDKEAYNETLH